MRTILGVVILASPLWAYLIWVGFVDGWAMCAKVTGVLLLGCLVVSITTVIGMWLISGRGPL